MKHTPKLQKAIRIFPKHTQNNNQYSNQFRLIILLKEFYASFISYKIKLEIQ